MSNLPPGFVLDGAPAGPIYGPPPKAAPPPTPFQVEDQSFQRDAQARAAEQAERERIRFQAEYNPDGTKKVAAGGGKALPDAAARRIETGVGNFAALANSLAGFKDEYAGNTFTGGMENTLQGLNSNIGSEGQRDWWANFRTLDNAIRNDLFGATLTPSEQKSYSDTTVSPSMDPAEVKRNLQRRADLLRGALDRQRRYMTANGFNQEAVDILYEPVTAMEALGGDKPATPPGAPPAEQVAAPLFSPGNPQMEAVTDGTRNEDDPALAGVRAAYQKLLESSTAPGDVIRQLRSLGVTDPEVLRTAGQQAKFRRDNPDFPLDRYNFEKVDDRVVSLSPFEQAATAIGDTAIGAYAMQAGQALSGNTLDNLSADPERARANLDIAATQSPTASTLGTLSGSVMGMMAGEAGLARLGMGAGMTRGLVADTGYGAAAGAGGADDGNRLAGAAQGGAMAGLGSLVGQGAVQGLSRAVAPSGGSLADLYAAGVKPTLGQRVADKGAVGRFVNQTEQKLQSIPIVGDAISGARQEARDQFQVGAFNESLREIGEALPKGMKPGTDPHAFTQAAFNRVYDKARSGMTLVPDQQLAQDLGTLGPDIATLGPAMQNKLRAIMTNNVNNRIKSGVLDGPAYKQTMSDLGRHIDRLGRSTDSEQQALGEVLKGVRGSLDEAARRSSDPDAVALLDAADAGYAKFVRIEEAAARRGSEAGTFSGNAFDASVQKASGGVRSKSYLRGDALMQDFAQQGRALDDTVPDSGTATRAMAGAGAAGAAYLDPTAAAVLGTVALAYAPGARKVMQGALSPAGPGRKAIASQLKRISRVTGATSAAVALPGTTPSQ